MAFVTSKKLATCRLPTPNPSSTFSSQGRSKASFPVMSHTSSSLGAFRTARASPAHYRASMSSVQTRVNTEALFSGRRELWALPEGEVFRRRALMGPGEMGLKKRRSQNGPRAFARRDGNTSNKEGRETSDISGLINYRVWRADNQWLAEHGIPTLEVEEPGRLPRLHLNSKLDLPPVKLPPSLEWLDLYGESQVNLRKKLAVTLDPFGEPQVKLRERLKVTLDPFGEPQVKLRERIAVNLDPYGEPQVKLREKIAVNLDPYGEPQVKLREQLAASLKPPLTKPSGGHKPLIFYPPGTIEETPKEKMVKPGKPNPFLEGNFAPVDEECPEEIPCHVIGDLPGDLRGQFLRNGPNPRFAQDPGAYHWFDGDGMVHSLRFQGLDLPPVYSCKYVRTNGFNDETRQGRGKFWPGVRMEPLGRCLVTAAVRSMRRKEEERDVPGMLAVKNTANTGLIRHAGKLFAMWEGGHPYVVNEDLDTQGPTNFDGRLLSSFSAHPKVDPQTGELIYFGYSVVTRPFLSYGVISKEGEIVHQADIDLPNPVMMHDFAITEHYSIFLDFPFVFNAGRVMEVVNGKRGKPFAFDPTAAGRIGVMPRFGTERDIQWFEVGPGMVLHVLNAYEETGNFYDTFPDGASFECFPAAGAFSGVNWGVTGSDGLEVTRIGSDGGGHWSRSLYDGLDESDGPFSSAGISDGRFADTTTSSGGFSSAGKSDGASSSRRTSNGLKVPGGVAEGGAESPAKRPVIVLRAMHYDCFTGLGLADVINRGAKCPEDAYLHEYRLDLETGTVAERRVSDISADFPVINGSRQGLYNRYGYMSRFAANGKSVSNEFGCSLTPLFDALVKLDLETGAVQTHEFGPGRLGGEAAFVPRAAPVQPPEGFEEILDQLPSYLLDFLPPGASPQPQGMWANDQPEETPGDEDEGWLVVHVWDEALQQSEVLVIDAKDFGGPVLARVVLPRRVPYGFHGTFLPDEASGSG